MAKPEPEKLTDIGTDEDGAWAEGVVKEQVGSGPIQHGDTEYVAEETIRESSMNVDFCEDGTMKRTFASGATRDTEDGKEDLEGFLSPLVLERYAEYMHEHRHMADGTTRDSDNWQRGIPLDAYMKSAWRHFMDWWLIHRKVARAPWNIEDALCALLFNVSGYLHEIIKAR